MKRLIYIALIFTGLISCKKELDAPPSNILNNSKVITIDSLRALQLAVSPGGVSITDSLNSFAIVTMDESNGNIYKNLYVQDHTGGIQVRLTASSDFAVGDSVRINLFGAYLSEYNGVIQLDSIDPKTDIIKQSSGHPITPRTMTVEEVLNAASVEADFVDLEGTLIKIIGVQFLASELNTTYADAINQASLNKTLEDCAGNNMLVRTSGFADFANQLVAEGNGDFTAIVGRFGSDVQLIIREPNEINMNSTRCAGTLILKDFEDQVAASEGWTTVVVVGTTDWTTNSQGHTSYYGQISNYSGTNTVAESWLISPSIDLSSSSSPTISFLNAYKYTGDPLKLLVSTTYNGTGDPNASSWTDITSSVTWSAGNFAWINSGNIDLSAFNVSGVRIAFKYTGTATSGSTWEIDDIKING